jgi:hypothetical protein
MLMTEFDAKWGDVDQRRLIVPGKETLASLNGYLQDKYGVTVSPSPIIECFKKEEMEKEMLALIDELEEFR